MVHRASAALDWVLRALAPQQVVLTVLAQGEEVELYLVFRGPLTVGSSAADPLGRAVVEVDDSGAGCLELRWPKEVRR